MDTYLETSSTLGPRFCKPISPDDECKMRVYVLALRSNKFN